MKENIKSTKIMYQNTVFEELRHHTLYGGPVTETTEESFQKTKAIRMTMMI